MEWFRNLFRVPEEDDRELALIGAGNLIALYQRHHPNCDIVLHHYFRGNVLRGKPVGDFKITIEPLITPPKREPLISPPKREPS